MYTEHAYIDMSNAVGILYLSQKYLLPDLSQKVVSRAKHQMSADNVCSLLPYAHVFDDIHDRLVIGLRISQRFTSSIQSGPGLNF